MDATDAELDVVRTIPFFADLPEDQRERVLARARMVAYEPGEPIVERGTTGCTMWIVATGSARVDVGGRYHDLKRGDMLGEMSALSSKPRMRTVAAAEPLEAVELDCGRIDDFLMENPAVALHILKVLVERLREVEERLDAWMGAYHA